ncbi:MAG: LysR family transcriptional regulator [Chloroflexi bacterium]|nr:LysR family transcriptional regulator [Chloroflexota bacterium]
MEPRLKLWLEQDGRIALSEYRVRLLMHVRDTGSLSQAATLMRLSYRRAWGKVKELEENLGVPLVESEAGGAGGGHTRLTVEGELLVRRYEEFRDRMQRALEREFAASFGDSRIRAPRAVDHGATGASRS